MRRTVIVLALALAFLAAFLLRRSPSASLARERAGRSSSAAPAAKTNSAAPDRSAAISAGKQLASVRMLRERFAYAQDWSSPPSPALEAFRDWAERYGQAGVAARVILEAEGVTLAQARRAEMLRLIQEDPERALALTVPAVVRQILPAKVRDELEQRVAGTGDFEVIAGVPAAGSDVKETLERYVTLGRTAYAAHAYGRRGDRSKERASLHGIALDGHLALHESPLRFLEPGEITERSSEAVEPVTKRPVASLSAGVTVNESLAPLVVEAHGRLWSLASAEAVMEVEDLLVRAETGSGPRVQPFLLTSSEAGKESVAAAIAPSWSTGKQKVLVLRVDFSDLPGTPVIATAVPSSLNGTVLTPAVVTDFMSGTVGPFYASSSYGSTSLETTVSSTVYRLPQTATFYATGSSNYLQLHSDARAAASGDYVTAAFDRVVVLFSKLPIVTGGSFIGVAGKGDVVGSRVWINAEFDFRVVAHELGHTYGLQHANLWKVGDGNPVSTNATSTEYGDVFDTMGDGDTIADPRYDFNPWAKSRLNWLPDSAIKTVSSSGTYRLFRFDTASALAQSPLALRIFRDGVRWFYVGYRQGFPTNPSVINGVYVVWGFNGSQHSQLLDLTTPGSNPNDAALAVGKTFTDPVSGVSIHPVARGGNDPQQWIDVEVTIPAAPPTGVIAAWGLDTRDFITTPTLETNVPMVLTDMQAIAAGTSHVLALRPDGSVAGWGSNAIGQLDVPAGLDNVVAIAAGGNHSGALKRDGTVRLWGDPASKFAIPPAGLSGVCQLAVGKGHALALKLDGTVVAWGVNDEGESNVPAGLTNVVAVAAGDRHSVALKADGTVATWGHDWGKPPADLSGVFSISAGASHTVALKKDGTVVAWGSNGNGQISVPAGLTNVISMGAGEFHSLAVKSDGSIVAWGANSTGQTAVPASQRASFFATGSLGSSFALIGAPVYFTGQPQSQTVAVGGSTTFSATPATPAAFSYQWFKDGVAIPGATARSYTIPSVQTGSAGSYKVSISGPGISTTSNGAFLTVNDGAPAPDTSRLYAISCRAMVGTGGDILIPGIIVGGSGARQVVVRAGGPAIQGVPGTLARPQLTLYQVGVASPIATNTGWDTGGNASALQAAFAEANLPAYANGSADCALLATLNAGSAYTAQVSGLGTAPTGVALVEVYELGTSNARMTAISCRARVGTGSDILIPGIIIRGNSSKQVIVRAAGPALTSLGVPGALAQPRLQLYDSGGVKLAENIGWSNAPNVGGLSSATLAVGLPPFPPGSADCAMLVTLPPGGYTALVSGLNDSTGVALIEVYEIP